MPAALRPAAGAPPFLPARSPRLGDPCGRADEDAWILGALAHQLTARAAAWPTEPGAIELACQATDAALAAEDEADELRGYLEGQDAA